MAYTAQEFLNLDHESLFRRRADDEPRHNVTSIPYNPYKEGWPEVSTLRTRLPFLSMCVIEIRIMTRLIEREHDRIMYDINRHR
jgi:hypothetical protein